MLIVPDSKVILIKNPLKLDSNNEMMFANATAQYNYFTSLPKLEFDDLTYIRKDGVLRIPTDETATGTTYEDLLQYNFCMYQNTHFDDKWFYAFITDITWINPSMTEMKLETAYYQTWQFDLVYMDSYIEREHVNDDTRGTNLVDEGIQPQEYIVDKAFDIPFFNKDNFKVVIAVSEIVTGMTGNWTMQNVPFTSTQGNTYVGMCYITPYGTGHTADQIIRAYDEAGHADSIKYMFMCPEEVISWYSQNEYFGTLSDGSTYRYRVIGNNVSYAVNTGLNQKPTTLDGYSPKNNKMLQFPYCFISVDNHGGNMYNFNYEDFYTSGGYSFECDSMLCVGGSVKFAPAMYKTKDVNSPSYYTYGFTGVKFPTCGWVSDTYTNWLTQNAVNLGFTTIGAKEGGFLSSGINILGGLLTGNLGKVSQGINGIFNTLQTDYKASMLPDQVRGNENAGDINFAIGLVNPTINEMAIKNGQAKIIDDYFTMFGYKVNRLGKPHLHVRQYFDYIKTIDVNIEGNIPEPDLNEIRRMFNNGIRFWHSTTYYLNFSVNNSIIS